MITSNQLIAAAKARRQAGGLAVRNTGTGWTGYFATIEARDDFIARATRAGETVEIILNSN